MFKMLSAPTLEELRTKVDEFLKDRPNAMVEYGHIAIITDTTGDASDTVKLPPGSIVRECPFGRDNVMDIKYSESALHDISERYHS